MSKLTQQIETRRTGKEFVLLNEYVAVTEQLNNPVKYEYGRVVEYRIMSTFGSIQRLDQAALDACPSLLDKAIKRTKQGIIEAVFGEFRQDIQLLYKHLYNRDIDKAIYVVEDLDKRMFYE